LTSQRTISPSVKPSPISGNLNSNAIGTSIGIGILEWWNIGTTGGEMA
jgi:hypothetical protein